MRGRFIVLSVALTMVTTLTSYVPPAAAAPVVGRDGIGATTTLSPAAHRAAEPSVGSPKSAEKPPAGSPARARVDKILANAKTDADQVRARYKKTEVIPPVSAAASRPVVTAGKTEPALAQSEAVDPCAPIGTEQWFAQYSDGSILTTPTNTSEGLARVSITNRGSATWPAGQIWLGYHLFNGSGQSIPGTYSRTAVSGPVGTNGTATVNAKIDALAPGTYRIAWDLQIDGVGWFSDRGVCAMTIEYTIRNQAPNLTLQTPPNFGTVTTRTPSVFASGVDPDNWPGGPLQYQFTVCKDAALTTGCSTSGWQAYSGHQVPAGLLGWNDTFYWSARFRDGELTTPTSGWAPANQVKVVVPAPDKWRTVGTGLGLTNISGVVLPYNTWIANEVDADIAGVGVPLKVLRTYSADGQTTHGAFGRGWMSMFDASAQYSPDNTLLTITFPDGRQEIFAKQADGKWVTRVDAASSDRLTVAGDGVITVRGADQQVLKYGPAGELRTIESTGVGSLGFTRDAGGLVTTVTQAPSGRSLTVAWNTKVGGCGGPVPPKVAEITTQTNEKWRYEYNCSGMLSKVYDPTNVAAIYHTESIFWRDRAGRRPLLPSPNGSGLGDIYEMQGYQVYDTDIDVTTKIFIQSPRAGYGLEFTERYNQYGGAIVSVSYDAKGEGGVSHQTYRFDELNRLRTLHQGTWDDTSAPGRIWDYGTVINPGRLIGFIDETWRVKEITHDAYGNQTGNFVSRDPWTQVTHGSTYWPSVGDDPDTTRMYKIWSSPNQGNQSQELDMFAYDSAGRLTMRRGHPVPEAPTGKVSTFTYTTGAETAVGARRGGATPPGGDKMPAGLQRTSVSSGATTTFSYNGNGDLTEVVNPLGRKTAYDYDNLGRRVSVTEFSTGFPGGALTRFVLDGRGRTAEETRPATTNAVTGQAQQLRICRFYDGAGLVVKTVETGAAACPAAGAARRAGERTTESTFDSTGRLSTVVDAAGGTTTFTYGKAWRNANATKNSGWTRVVDPYGRISERWFDAGRVVEERKSNGTTRAMFTAALYAYDAAGRLVEQSDAVGRKTFYSYTWDDLVDRVTKKVYGGNGQLRDLELSKREYDGDGRVTLERVGNTQTVQYFYDGDGKLVDTVVDPSGVNRKLHRTYNLWGHVVSEASTSGLQNERSDYCRDLLGAVTCQLTVFGGGAYPRRTDYTVDQHGRTTSVTDPRGTVGEDPNPDYTASTTYDILGRAITNTGHRAEIDGVGQTRPVTTYGFDVFGQLTHVRDPRGELTTNTYDDAGRLLETRAPAYTPPGSSTPVVPTVTRTYHAAGFLTRMVDARGQATDYVYDLAGRLTETKEPAFAAGRPVSKREYDNADQVTAVVDPSGARTEFWYDQAGRRVSIMQRIRQPQGAGGHDAYTQHEYDDAGNLVKITSPMGAVTRMEYNGAGELTKLWKPNATKPITREYDLAGRVTKETDQAGRSVETKYDKAGNPVRWTKRSAGGVEIGTTYATYDYAGNLESVTKPNGGRVLHHVDPLNRVTAMTEQVSESEYVTARTVGYDIMGNPVRETDARGNVTTTTYNKLGLPETVTEPSTAAHPAIADRRTTVTYDVGGLPVKTSLPGGVTVDRQFDERGQLRKETGSGGGTTSTERWFSYDLNGRIGSISHPDQTRTFYYSDRGHLLSNSGPEWHIADFDYNADGRMIRRQDASGTSHFAWRTDGQLLWANDSLSGQVQDFEYHPDSAELTKVRWGNGVNRTLGRDLAGRVDKITTRNAGGVQVHDLSYVYDQNGNITSETVADDAAASSTYTYDLADRLTRWTPGGGGAAHDYTWDKAGNRTAEHTVAGGGAAVQVGSWTYDERNRLTASNTGTATAYTYTPRGTLSGTTRAGQGTTASTFDAFDQLTADGPATYRYDALGRLAERNGVLFEHAGLERDPVKVAGEVYSRDPVGVVMSAQFGGKTLAPITDAHGDMVGWNPLSQTSTAPAPPAGRTAFDPFGVRTMAAGNQSALGFQGDWTDPNTERVNMDARWYQPSAGSFVSRDSVDSGNRYLYGASNPVSNIDPDGHLCTGAGAAAGSALGPVGTITIGGAATGACVGAVAGPGGALIGGIVGGLGALVVGGLLWWAFSGDSPPPTPWSPPAPGTPTVQTGPGTITVTTMCPCPNLPVDLPIVLPVPPPAPPAPPPPPPPPPPPVLVVDTTETLVNKWSEWSTWTADGYRYVQVDNYTQTMAHHYKEWSNGAWWDSGWYQQSLVHDWHRWWIKTVDGTRVDGVVADAGAIANSGQLEGVIAQGPGGGCGLNGTLVSCLGEVLAPVVGAGCALVSANMHSCTPGEPAPGRPGGVQEAAGTRTAPAGPPVKPPAGGDLGSCMPDPEDGDWVDPNLINFSQRTVSPNDYVASMLDGSWDWNRPGTALRVVERGGQLVSYDNRRLDAAREVRSQDPNYRVRVERVDPGSPNPAKSSGMSWDKSFEQRMKSKRNWDENGCRVPWQGLFDRPEVEEK